MRNCAAWYYLQMKSLFLGIAFIILIGVGGLIYRNAVEHPFRPITCPLDALVCPDGTAVSRTGSACTFAACPPPNVALADIGISFAIPEGFVATTTPWSEQKIATYIQPTDSWLSKEQIDITRYPITASSTALSIIRATAIMDGSGLPASPTSFISVRIGNHQFTKVMIGRFEGQIQISYYLSRGADVLRFDAIDREVFNWTDANLDITTLPAQVAIIKLLASLQGK